VDAGVEQEGAVVPAGLQARADLLLSKVVRIAPGHQLGRAKSAAELARQRRARTAL